MSLLIQKLENYFQLALRQIVVDLMHLHIGQEVNKIRPYFDGNQQHFYYLFELQINKAKGKDHCSFEEADPLSTLQLQKAFYHRPEFLL